MNISVSRGESLFATAMSSHRTAMARDTCSPVRSPLEGCAVVGWDCPLRFPSPSTPGACPDPFAENGGDREGVRGAQHDHAAESHSAAQQGDPQHGAERVDGCCNAHHSVRGHGKRIDGGDHDDPEQHVRTRVVQPHKASSRAAGIPGAAFWDTTRNRPPMTMMNAG